MSAEERLGNVRCSRSGRGWKAVGWGEHESLAPAKEVAFCLQKQTWGQQRLRTRSAISEEENSKRGYWGSQQRSAGSSGRRAAGAESELRETQEKR